MVITKEPLHVFKNYNSVEIYDDVVVKNFKNEKKFKRELAFYNIFKDYFKVPEILDVSADNCQITYERIKGHVLWHSSVLKNLTAKDLFDIRNRVPHLRGAKISNNLVKTLPAEVIDGSLVHGDLLLNNMIMKNNEVYLIDFEKGNYLFREFDDAYLTLSIYFEDEAKAFEYGRIASNNNADADKINIAKCAFLEGMLNNKNIQMNIKQTFANSVLKSNMLLRR